MRSACARVLGLLVAIAIAIPVYGQSTGLFAGVVIDRDGKPISGATVVIERKEVGLKLEVKTDRNGRYIRTGLDDGTYQLTVVNNGVPVANASETISLGFRVDHDFDLRALEKQQQSQASAGTAAISRAQRDAETKVNTETQGAFNAGLNALKAGNFDEAVKQFNLASERRPNQPTIYNRLGETYAAAKKYNEAAEAYKKATELSPNDTDYFYNLGINAAQAGKFDVAKAAIQKSVDIEPPRGGVAFYNLAKILDKAGQDKDAVDAMQRSIKQNPKNADAYYELGLMLMKNSETIPQSAAQFEKFLQIESKGERADTARNLLAAAKAAGPAK
jgi:tetratricopeptide (TPR) repeat protein